MTTVTLQRERETDKQTDRETDTDRQSTNDYDALGGGYNYDLISIRWSFDYQGSSRSQ